MLDSALDVYNTSAKDSLPNEAKLISRVHVGTYWEAPILNVEKVYIDVYTIMEGFILCCDWDWTCIQVSTAEQAQSFIEHIQDTWLALAARFDEDYL